MNNICFIPAKGYSRRLPKKNLQLIGGKTLIARAVESSISSQCFSKIIVSSNDDEILDIAVKFGVTAIRRPDNLCADDIRAKDVLKYHLDNMQEEYDSVAMLMPSNPLRNEIHIKEAYQIYNSSSVNTLISVVEYDFNPSMAMSINTNGILKPFNTEVFKWQRENQFPKYYHFNGAIFIAAYGYFMKNITFLDDSTMAYVMDKYSSIDIDTEDDLKLAEYYYEVVNDRCN